MTLARLVPAVALMVTALPLTAQETRQMDAHVHGTGALQIAIDASTVSMDITVPGADIVGFEHAPGSDADHAAIEAALTQFGDAFTLFTLEGDAGCTAVTRIAHTHGYGIEHADHHGDAMHADDDHGHDDHGHDDHATHSDHDNHDKDHAGGDGHAEFHAIYDLTCTDPAAITAIAFPYFDLFPTARELDVQIVSGTGAMAAKVLRDTPRLSLTGAM